jgi:putative membrane protein
VQTTSSRGEKDEIEEPNATPLPVHLSVSAGLLMGGADAIPGVSGGTIALVVGVYDRFIDALSSVIRLPLLVRTPDGRGRLKRALALLVPLGAGLLVAYYAATKLLVGPVERPGIMLRSDTAPICYAFFFGLVLVSLREPWRRIHQPSPVEYGAAAAACVGAILFIGLPHGSGEPATWMLLWGGAGSVAVMLLPGVSGSLFLVIVGQYATVAGAVHDRNVGLLVVFLVGLAAGVISFVPFLRYLLRTRHDITMAALTGLMAGSLRALWPWKDNYNPKLGPMNNLGVGDHLPWAIAAFVAGGAVVWLLARLERRVLEAQRSSR